MHVEPMKPKLKPPGTKRLKLKLKLICDNVLRMLLSNSACAATTRFAADRNNYGKTRKNSKPGRGGGRGLHSYTFRLNLRRFCHKIHLKHPLVTP